MLHLQKKKLHLKVCRYKINLRNLDTQVDRGRAEIFTLNTLTKTREKVINKWEVFLHASRYWLWHNTYSSELLAGFRKAEA